MVLTVHADFSTFGVPTSSDIVDSPWSSFGRIFVESSAIMGVNIFIMISGWFGIKPTIKGFCNFAFQVLYFYSLCLLGTWIFGINDLSIKNIAHVFCLPDNGWFIVSYSCLYVLAPMLNMFLDNASKKIQIQVMTGFFILQMVYAFIGTSHNYNLGYSTLSFIGLYLLSGFARRYWAIVDVKMWGVIAWFIISCAISMTIFIIPRSSGRMLAYSNPLVIAASLALILQFSKLRLGSIKSINFIAASAFGVYLLHANIFTQARCYQPMMEYLGNNYGTVAIVVAMILTFTVAIVIDLPRKWLWKLITKYSNSLKR